MSPDPINGSTQLLARLHPLQCISSQDRKITVFLPFFWAGCFFFCGQAHMTAILCSFASVRRHQVGCLMPARERALIKAARRSTLPAQNVTPPLIT